MVVQLDMDVDYLLAIKWVRVTGAVGRLEPGWAMQNYHNCDPGKLRTQYFRCENN